MKIIVVLRVVLRRCLELITYLSNEGSWTLKSHEKIILSGAMKSLEQDERDFVDQRLGQSFFMERIGGRICIFRFYSKNVDELLVDPRFSDMLIRVSIDVEGLRQIANVTFYKGDLFSIELPMSVKYYRNKEVQSLKSSLGKPKQTYTIDINKDEHS